MCFPLRDQSHGDLEYRNSGACLNLQKLAGTLRIDVVCWKAASTCKRDNRLTAREIGLRTFANCQRWRLIFAPWIEETHGEDTCTMESHRLCMSRAHLFYCKQIEIVDHTIRFPENTVAMLLKLTILSPFVQQKLRSLPAVCPEA